MSCILSLLISFYCVITRCDPGLLLLPPILAAPPEPVWFSVRVSCAGGGGFWNAWNEAITPTWNSFSHLCDKRWVGKNKFTEPMTKSWDHRLNVMNGASKKKKKAQYWLHSEYLLWLLLPFISKGSFQMLEERWLTPLSPPSLFSGSIDHLTHVCLGNWQMTGHGEARSHLDLQGKQGLQSCLLQPCPLPSFDLAAPVTHFSMVGRMVQWKVHSQC